MKSAATTNQIRLQLVKTLPFIKNYTLRQQFLTQNLFHLQTGDYWVKIRYFPQNKRARGAFLYGDYNSSPEICFSIREFGKSGLTLKMKKPG
jgi:hypothetical protein